MTFAALRRLRLTSHLECRKDKTKEKHQRLRKIDGSRTDWERKRVSN